MLTTRPPPGPTSTFFWPSILYVRLFSGKMDPVVEEAKAQTDEEEFAQLEEEASELRTCLEAEWTEQLRIRAERREKVRIYSETQEVERKEKAKTEAGKLAKEEEEKARHLAERKAAIEPAPEARGLLDEEDTAMDHLRLESGRLLMKESDLEKKRSKIEKQLDRLKNLAKALPEKNLGRMKLKTLIAGRLRVPSDEGQDENESFESAEEQPLETMDFEEMIRKTERLLKTIDNELKTFGERKKAVERLKSEAEQQLQQERQQRQQNQDLQRRLRQQQQHFPSRPAPRQPDEVDVPEKMVGRCQVSQDGAQFQKAGMPRVTRNVNRNNSGNKKRNNPRKKLVLVDVDDDEVRQSCVCY